jgi:hypothetical protein
LPAIAVRIFAEVSPMPAVNEAVYALHSRHSGDQPARVSSSESLGKCPDGRRERWDGSIPKFR